MKNYILILFLLAECVTAEQIPLEVKNTISETLNGKWVFQSFEKNRKKLGFDSTTKLSDIKTGEPFEVYEITQEKFENANESTPVCSLMKSYDDWLVPLYVNGELVQTILNIGNRYSEKEKWSAWANSGKSFAQAWEKVRKVWPESLGYHPKFVTISTSIGRNVCLFVPEKGDSNLTIFGSSSRFGYRLLSDSSTTNFSNLTPSRETFRYLREQCDEHQRKIDSLWKEHERINDSLVKELELKTEDSWKDLELEYYKTASATSKTRSDSNVTSWWEGRLMQADSVIIPVSFCKSKTNTFVYGPKNPCNGNSKMFEINQDGISPDSLDCQILKTALPLRYGAGPIDNVVTKGQIHLYELFENDCNGFIRIGATGPILTNNALFTDSQVIWRGYDSSGGPEHGADLIEISEPPIIQAPFNWPSVKNVYLIISTTSNSPVSYRISFAPELPENRTGSHYGPDIVAREYIEAIAIGNINELYNKTRAHFTIERVTALREKLFGKKDKFDTFGWDRRNGVQVNVKERLHVQHIIFSDKNGNNLKNWKSWAFVITCIQSDGLWFVANANRDPELSDSQVSDIVERDMRKRYPGYFK